MVATTSLKTFLLTLVSVSAVLGNFVDSQSPANDFIHIASRAPADRPEACYKENKLGIKFDSPSIARTSNPKQKIAELLVYSSKLKFPNVQDVLKEVLDGEDAQFSMMAKNGYLEMVKEHGSKKVDRRPGVMTGMALGSEIFLSSSIKQKEFANLIVDTKNWEYRSTAPKPLLDCLDSCKAWYEEHGQGQQAEDDTSNVPLDMHRTNAGCGECAILYQYFQSNPQKQDCNGATFVTVIAEPRKNKQGQVEDPGFDSFTTLEDKLRVIDPCGTEWIDPSDPKYGYRVGCALMTTTCKGRAINEGNNWRNFADYYIGKYTEKPDGKDANGNAKTVDETEADYKKSPRYYETTQIKINLNGMTAEKEKKQQQQTQGGEPSNS